MISSIHNRLIKKTKALHEKKSRESENAFLAEGVRIAGEAVLSNARIKWAFYSSRLLESERGRRVHLLLEKKGVPLYLVTERIMSFLSTTKSAPPVIIVAGKPETRWMFEKERIAVYLEKISDPGNLGTIIRTAEASWASSVSLSEGSTDLFSPKVVRATSGSLFRFPLIEKADSARWAEEVRRAGLRIMATATEKGRLYTEVDFSQGAGIIMGSEPGGLSENTKTMADEVIRIPMKGEVESLNIAVALGIILYEALRQRTRNRKSNI